MNKYPTAAGRSNLHDSRASLMQMVMNKIGSFIQGTVLMILAVICVITITGLTFAMPLCPISYGATDAAKSHKFFLYFPLLSDSTFPDYGIDVSPALPFDVAGLDPAIGTTAALRDRIYDVVADDYCEFNVQVLQTTTNPALLPMPPARRVTVAVGSDDNPSNEWWGLAPVDTNDTVNVDFARVWAGKYLTCEGGDGLGNCSPPGALVGANSTLERWAQAIGGTAAHEGGHTYGLAHRDDNQTTGCGDPGFPATPGEDALTRHLMPTGCNLSGEHRASYRRHFSNRTYGLLATNVGLSIQTMHNWDLVNPNAADANSLAMDFLSTSDTVPNVDWSYHGSASPWINPVVTGPTGTTTFKGTEYKNYHITWSAANPGWSGGTPGVVTGGQEFHIGATFTGVDFNAPDAVIIQNVTLFNSGSSPLPLHPRLPMYDAGAVDADGAFAVHFFAQPEMAPLVMQDARILQLPRVASIDSMIGAGRPFSFDQVPIRPWSEGKCGKSSLVSSFLGRSSSDRSSRCAIAKLTDPAHVSVTRKIGEKNVYDCSKGYPKVNQLDSPGLNDNEGPICAGSSRDPFPSTTVYMIATFVDPQARHYDPKLKRCVIGPVVSKVYFQFAGVRDLSKIKIN